MKLTAPKAQALRHRAQNFRKTLETNSESWSDSRKPSLNEYDGVVTSHRWLENSEGDKLHGFISRKDGELKRLSLSHYDKTSSGLVSQDIEMRSTPPAAWTAGFGESTRNLGFALSAAVPGGFLVGVPMMKLGNWLIFDKSEPNINIYKHRENGGEAKFAKFDQEGHFLGSDVRESQQSLFT